MRALDFVALVLSVAAAAAGPASACSNDVKASASVAGELLSADRGFSAQARGRSAVDAISAMLADDVILYVLPVPSQARTRPDAIEVLNKAFSGEPGTVSWIPVRVGISADGSHGFTYGFIDRSTASKEPIPGKYVAYWIKRHEGWRVAAYKLVPRPVGRVSTASRPASLPDHIFTNADVPVSLNRSRDELGDTERQFSDDAQVIGLGAAFRKYGTEDAMNVGGEADFTYGNDAIADSLGGDAPSPSAVQWDPDGVIVAPSGDLGFTFGYLQRNGPVPPGKLSRIPWFTVWRRNSPQDPWRYIAE